MFRDPTIRKSVLASIIASILVIVFIQPILTAVLRLINFLGEHVYIGFSNQIYYNASLGERPTIVFLMFGAVVVVINAFVAGVTLTAFRSPRITESHPDLARPKQSGKSRPMRENRA